MFDRFRDPVTALALASLAAPIPAQVTVATFKDDRPGAYVFTFDDALPTQLIYAAPYLDQVGLKGSFYLITNGIVDGDAKPAIGSPTTWKGWKALADNGHEIGSHTLTHSNLTQLSADSVAKELAGSARIIKEKTGVTPTTVVYPFNAWNAAVAAEAAKTYLAARESQVTYGDVAGGAKTAEAMNKFPDAAVSGKALRIAMVHGITEPYAPTDTAAFLDHLWHCKRLEREGKLWVARFGDAMRYRKERDSTRITVKSKDANHAEFLAESHLDPARFDFPLTFIVPYAGELPATATAVRAGRAGTLPVTVQAGRILVEAVPGPGAIRVEWSGKADTVKPEFPLISTLPDIDHLPDPFLQRNGKRISGLSAWAAQRQHLLDMLAHYEYGTMPPAPGNVKATLLSTSDAADGKSRTRRFRIACGPGSAVTLEFTVEAPAAAGRYPAIIAIGDQGAMAEGARKGYMMIAFDQESLARDNQPMATEIPAYASYDWGNLAAWAWGAHRIVDWLQGEPDADPGRIAVTGHSRYGKAALWAGALDERIALVAPNHSGTGGAESGKFGKGETVTHVATRFSHWFQSGGRYARCGDSANIARMPFDAHFLKAAVAPRHLIDLEGTKDPIVNAWGSAQTTYAARRVYDYLGATGKIVQHHCDCGHIADWDGLFAYTDHLWFGRALPAGYSDPGASFAEEARLIPWGIPVSSRAAPSRRPGAAGKPAGSRGGYRADGRLVPPFKAE